MKRRNIKRVLSLVLALLLYVGLFAGCGSSDVDENEIQTAAVEKNSSNEQTDNDPEHQKENADSELGLYKETLEYYYDQAVIGWPDEEYSDVSYMFPRFNPDVSDIGYTLIDLDSDGSRELIMGCLDSYEKDAIYDLFTIIGGKVKHVCSGGERDRFYLLSDNTIRNEGSSGASDTVATHLILKGGEFLTLEHIHMTDFYSGEYTAYYGTNLNYNEMRSAMTLEEEIQYCDRHMQEIPLERADEIIQKWPYLKRLELTPLTSLAGKSGKESENVKKAQTHTYEAVKADVSWVTAEEMALAKGGELVSINNADEFSKVCAEADAKGLKIFWVGAWRTMEETWDDIGWLDGTPLNVFTKWYKGEPSYTDGNSVDGECYLMVFKVNGSWYFNDAMNDVISAAPNYKGKMGYVVEYK